MNLNQLDDILPGEKDKRLKYLQEQRDYLREKYNLVVEPITYRNLEMMSLDLITTEGHYKSITSELIDYIVETGGDIRIYFKHDQDA